MTACLMRTDVLAGDDMHMRVVDLEHTYFLHEFRASSSPETPSVSEARERR